MGLGLRPLGLRVSGVLGLKFRINRPLGLRASGVLGLGLRPLGLRASGALGLGLRPLEFSGFRVFWV